MPNRLLRRTTSPIRWLSLAVEADFLKEETDLPRPTAERQNRCHRRPVFGRFRGEIGRAGVLDLFVAELSGNRESSSALAVAAEDHDLAATEEGRQLLGIDGIGLQPAEGHFHVGQHGMGQAIVELATLARFLRPARYIRCSRRSLRPACRADGR